jgi:hypothetical protein
MRLSGNVDRGIEGRGSLVCAIPTRNGLVISSDSLITFDNPRELFELPNSKIFRISRNKAFATTGTCTVYAPPRPRTISNEWLNSVPRWLDLEPVVMAAWDKRRSIQDQGTVDAIFEAIRTSYQQYHNSRNEDRAFGITLFEYVPASNQSRAILIGRDPQFGINNVSLITDFTARMDGNSEHWLYGEVSWFERIVQPIAANRLQQFSNLPHRQMGTITLKEASQLATLAVDIASEIASSPTTAPATGVGGTTCLMILRPSIIQRLFSRVL